MAKAKIGDIVLVKWVDSSRIIEWTFDAPILKRFPHESVGFLSHKDQQAINVRPHRLIDGHGEEQHVGDIIIPIRAVLSIEVLR